MTESLFLIPECFDDEDVMDEVSRYIDDPDVIFVAGDLAEDLEFLEDEAVSILANYGQVRNFLHKKVLGRGYNRPQRPGPSGQRPKDVPRQTYPRPQRSNAARPKRWSNKFLVTRSICARCGQKGRWARECKNETDERGKMRQQQSCIHFLTMGEESEPQAETTIHYMMDQPTPTEIVTYDQEAAEEEAGQAFVFTIFSGIGVEAFIGLAVAPGFALVDTGAQHGVLGPEAYKQVVDRLAVHGLKPRIINTLQLIASGVGGTTKFIRSAEIPVGLQGSSGILTIHVIDQEIPLLLPVGFCRGLGMIMDTTQMQIHWKAINKTSELHELGTGSHLAIEIFEFPKTGWKCPHSQNNQAKTVVGSGHNLDRKITRKHFELSPGVFGSNSCGLSLFGETETDVGNSSMPTPRFGRLDKLQSAAESGSNPRAGSGTQAATSKVGKW